MSDERDAEVLRERARALAAPRLDAAAAASSGEVLVFRVRRATYAVATDVVLGVRKLEAISPAPRGVGLAGLAVVDGEIVSVLRLDSVGPALPVDASLVVVLGKAKPELALLVDEVVELRSSADPDSGGSEAIVVLDGVALLRSRTSQPHARQTKAFQQRTD